MTSSSGERREAIDGPGIVARFWWKLASNNGPQTFSQSSLLDRGAVRVTAAGIDADDARIVLHARQNGTHTGIQIGNVDTRAAAMIHLSGGEVDLDAVLKAGTDLDRLAGLSGVTQVPIETSFRSVTTDLQSV